MNEKWIKGTFAEMRKRVQRLDISEERMRKDIYKDNPQYENPDFGIERIIQRIYHPLIFRFERREKTWNIITA